MHKLRLRGKSQSRAKEGGLANGHKDKPGNVSKSSIKHKVPSSAGSSEARSSRQEQQQPVLRLNSQDGNGDAAAGEDADSFRTSLILVR
jgi:hypothetical protein